MQASTKLNVVFVGSSGNGKSSACNTLCKHAGIKEKFKVSHSPVSETRVMDHQVIESLGLNIIDTPGFNDTSMSEEKNADILKNLIPQLMEAKGGFNPNINCFCLVTKLTPRCASLKQDMASLRSIFGRQAFKSLLLIVIDQQKQPKDQIFKEIKDNCQESTRFLREARGAEFSEDWCVFWDNKTPYSGQVEELKRKVQKLVPYTHETFLQAQKDLRLEEERRVAARVQMETERLRREHEEEKARDQIKLQQAIAEREKLRQLENQKKVLQEQNRQLQEAACRKRRRKNCNIF